MSVRRRAIAEKVLRSKLQGTVLGRRVSLAAYLMIQGDAGRSLLGRYLRYRERRWNEFMEWAAR